MCYWRLPAVATWPRRGPAMDTSCHLVHTASTPLPRGSFAVAPLARGVKQVVDKVGPAPPCRLMSRLCRSPLAPAAAATICSRWSLHPPSILPPLSLRPPSVPKRREDGGTMEGGWRDNGGITEGQWREDGGTSTSRRLCRPGSPDCPRTGHAVGIFAPARISVSWQLLRAVSVNPVRGDLCILSGRLLRS